MSLPKKCPLCGAEREKQKVVTSHVYGDKLNSRAFYHCPNCDVRYLHPSLTPEEEAEFYAAEFEGFMAGRSGASGGWQGAENHVLANEPTRIRRNKYLAPYIFEGASVLEVGCSSGFMLFPLIKEGHICIGIEPSGLFSEYVKNQGVVVYPSLKCLAEKGITISLHILSLRLGSLIP